MGKINIIAFVMVICATLSACFPIQLHPDNEPVRIIFSEVALQSAIDSGCVRLGFLTSSYGNWYNYLYISNADLINGAADDMTNKANEIGANLVYVKNIDFATSVTFMGQAYKCSSLSKQY